MTSFLKGLGIFILSSILSVIVFGGYFIGIIHAFKKHKNTDGYASIFFVLPAYYWSAEKYFWHEENVVNYDIECQRDLKLFILFCDEVSKGENSAKSIEDKAIFKTNFLKYPSEIQDTIRNQSRAYLDYVFLIQLETVNYLKDIAISKDNVHDFALSNKALEIGKNLMKYGIESETNNLKLNAIEITRKIKDVLKENKKISDEDLIKLINSTDEYFTGQKESLKSLYRDIFNSTY